MMKCRHITELDDFLAHWPFFLEGLEMLNSPKGGNGRVQKDRFFKTLLRVALGQPCDGAVMVLYSKNDKPLAFIVMMDNTPLFDVQTALCFAIYSNDKCATAVQTLIGHVRTWCKEHGYVRVCAASRKISGGAARLFEWKWGFKKECMVFTQNV